MKYIKDYHNAPERIFREAELLIGDILNLVGSEASHWSLQIGGCREKRRAEAQTIILRAKVLEQLVKQRTSGGS